MRLIWDDAENRRYETGISKGVLYPLFNHRYQHGVVWNGLTSITETLSGSEPNNIYADDVKYLELRAAEDFGATIEAYSSPREFKVCDGTVELIPGVNIGQQTRRPFGLCYQTKIGNGNKSDHGYKIHLIYNATVGPAEKKYTSLTDSPEPISFSWEAATTPVVVSDYKPTSFIIIDSTKCLKDHLEELEEILYGSEDADARLPLPDEVMDIMGGEASFFYINNEGELIYDGPHPVDIDFYLAIIEGELYCYYESDQFNLILDPNGRLLIEEVINNGN